MHQLAITNPLVNNVNTIDNIIILTYITLISVETLMHNRLIPRPERSVSTHHSHRSIDYQCPDLHSQVLLRSSSLGTLVLGRAHCVSVYVATHTPEILSRLLTWSSHTSVLQLLHRIICLTCGVVNERARHTM